MLQVQCPHCQHHIQATPDFAGRPAICPNCKQEFLFPQAAPPPTATPVHPPQQTVVVHHQLPPQPPRLAALGWFTRAFGAGIGWTFGTILAFWLVMLVMCGGGIALIFFCAGMQAW